MHITAVDVEPVSVPFVEPVRWRYGAMAGITSLVLRVGTDAGIEGLGEVPGVPSVDVARAAVGFFTPLFVGADPLRVRHLMARAAAGGAGHFPYVANAALGGLEMALWDICGKVLGCPVHQLFGGLSTPQILFYWHVNSSDGTEEGAIAHAREGIRRGYTTMYLKGGDIEQDLRMLEALRADLGSDVLLRLDPNEGWSYIDAMHHSARLARLTLEFLEQPFELGADRAARELRKRANVRIGANQSAWLVRDVVSVVARDASDVVVTGIHQAGGMLAFAEAETVCRLAGVPLVRHSLCDLGIGTAAALQVMATWAPGRFAHQTHLQLLEHDLLVDPWVFSGAGLDVPVLPGLGVELDEGALGLYGERYDRVGEYKSYATG